MVIHSFWVDSHPLLCFSLSLVLRPLVIIWVVQEGFKTLWSYQEKDILDPTSSTWDWSNAQPCDPWWSCLAVWVIVLVFIIRIWGPDLVPSRSWPSLQVIIGWCMDQGHSLTAPGTALWWMLCRVCLPVCWISCIRLGAHCHQSTP